MPNWREILDELRTTGGAHDVIRRKYLQQLTDVTKRNVIIYYSGWLQKGTLQRAGVSFGIDDGDKNGFMTAVNKLDRTKGLDLVLHTPGGETAATESIVYYLRSMFNDDIRAIVPQLAMSAGTMIALACKVVVMGEQSSLGPIDPQIGGVPAHGIIEEFRQAATEIQRNPMLAHVWQPIIAKYNPTLIGESQKAIDWSSNLVKEWLKEVMFKGETDAQTKADAIVTELADHALTKSHARHISKTKAKDLGIKVFDLEADKALQDAVLSVHHACVHTLTETQAVKIVENHMGAAMISQAATQLIVQGPVN
jgi:ClpP class serine protease